RAAARPTSHPLIPLLGPRAPAGPLPSLVDVFEEDPVVEAAALGALAARLRHDGLPAHVMGRTESPEDFQKVGQFRGQLPVRCCLRFMSLLQELRPQGRLITGVVQDPGDGLTSVCRDDARDLVADELVVGDAHDLDSTARLIAAKWQRVAIPGRGPDPSGGTGGISSASAGTWPATSSP